ncbi:hypothetical protein [Phaffia rhodozyma]|uniref:Uncharacterized protein n=1 Tax=Phaffia rhodozyma TaxID=264483 RepID=A0A0F7SEP4_PHARH|nr:hypothetical protein [Phaffia rhodozyma]
MHSPSRCRARLARRVGRTYGRCTEKAHRLRRLYHNAYKSRGCIGIRRGTISDPGSRSPRSSISDSVPISENTSSTAFSDPATTKPSTYNIKYTFRSSRSPVNKQLSASVAHSLSPDDT